MFKWVFTLAFLFNAILIYACSCGPYIDPFCHSADSTDYIALVELISFDDVSAAQFKRIENIHKEIPDTIAVLGQDGLNCNLDFTAFEVGDTLVLNLFYDGLEVQNSYNLEFYQWQVFDCTRHYLEYSSGILYGRLTSASTQVETEYEHFKEQLFTCLDISLNMSELYEESVQIYPNPFQEEIRIDTEDLIIMQVNVYNINGQLIQSVKPANVHSLKISISNHDSGIYLVEISTPKGIIRRKLLKS